MRGRGVAVGFVVVLAAAASVGTAEAERTCTSDDDCRGVCEQTVAFALEAQADAGPADVTMSSRECSQYALETPEHTVSDRPHCRCSIRGGRSFDLWGNDRFCLAVARNAQCLLDASELPLDVCDLGVGPGCSGACGILEERLEEDAARDIDIALVAPSCDGVACRCIVEMDGACFEQLAFERAPDGPQSRVPCP